MTSTAVVHARQPTTRQFAVERQLRKSRTGRAFTFFLFLHCGAMAGAISGGWLADKFHIKHVLMTMYALGAVFLYLMTVKMPQELLYLIVACVGATTGGRGGGCGSGLRLQRSGRGVGP